MTRRNFLKSVIVARFKHCGGRCELCGVVLKPGGYHCDHVNPDGLTGEPTFENAMIVCIPCHAEKTKRDVGAIAKAKRVEARHIGATRPKGMIRNRGFEPSGKTPRIDKSALPTLSRRNPITREIIR